MAFPSFFKVILEKSLEEQKMMIPKKFVRDYGKFLPSAVHLQLPDGMKWKVGLTTTSDGVVWLQKGWHSFAQHYRLVFGSFLVFRFDGNSTFHTTIFNVTGVETQYSLYFNQDEGFETFSGQQRSEQKTTTETSLPPKIELAEEEEENSLSTESISRRRSPPDQKVSNLEPEKTGFKVVMRKTHVEGRFNMGIPKEFAKKYLNDFGTINVKNSEGRSWALVYKWYQNHENANEYVYISSGWKCFAEENHLKEGDIVFFEMVKKDHFLFSLEESSLSPPISPKNYNATSSRNPFFRVKIQLKCHKNSVMNIPSKFVNDHLSPRMHTARLVVGNNQWKVGIKKYDNCTRFSAGWTRFFWQNFLVDGDSCLFELVHKTDTRCVFKVDIFKKL